LQYFWSDYFIGSLLFDVLTCKGGQEGEVQPRSLGQGHIPLPQQICPTNQLIQTGEP
jgi:hypothetical protein